VTTEEKKFRKFDDNLKMTGLSTRKFQCEIAAAEIICKT
jgi:hypothetical protein